MALHGVARLWACAGAVCFGLALPVFGQVDDTRPPVRGDAAGLGLADLGGADVLTVLQPGTAAPPVGAGVVTAGGQALAALPNGIATLDPDRLYAQSEWGRKAQARLDAEGRALIEENERLEAELTSEEAELSRLRESLSAEEFRRRADSFDERAQKVRRERAQALSNLQDRAEAERTAFLEAAIPLITELMDARGLTVILDQRIVFLSSRSVDLTEDAIALVDERLGRDGLPDEDSPPATQSAP